MVTLDQVASMALELPEVSEAERRGTRIWTVAGPRPGSERGMKCFAWERPFSQADLRRFGGVAPPGDPILAVRVADLGEKEAILAARSSAFFTIPHFDGFAAVLIELRAARRSEVREALLDAWLTCAPLRLTRQHLKG
jgi:hypothetical protein